MLFQPRVLVVAASDGLAGPLCQGLDGLGWSTLTARNAASAFQALKDYRLEVVIIDAGDGGANELAAQLRKMAHPRHLPILAIGEIDLSEADKIDLIMSASLHPMQAAMRLDQLTRAGIAEEEFSLRQQTFDSHGVSLEAPDLDDNPLQILTAGSADRRFLPLANALREAGAEVVAAPTPFTAFDFLHERAFDGVVLWGGDDLAPALSITAGMKRNARLYHIPLVLYLKRDEPVPHDLFSKGVADVILAATPEQEAAERVMGLARNHRRLKSIRRALDSARGSELVDATTGLFTSDLFANHLKRVAAGALQRGRPVCVCVLRVAQRDALVHARKDGWLKAALPQVGTMISRLVRVEDTAACLSPEVFALILPSVNEGEARQAAERISAVIGCTAFEAGEGRSPFVIELEVGVAEARPGESPGLMLERASNDLRG